jgi:hypothetical protein
MFTPELLASGQLANSATAIYTVPTGMRAKIEVVTYFNTTGGALSCSTYINDGTQREIHRASVPTVSRTIVIDETAPLYLDAADVLLGAASSATSVNYHVFGQLEQKA